MSRMLRASGEAGARRREPAVARGGRADEHERDSAARRGRRAKRRTGAWHSTRRARTNARATSGGVGERLRGLRQRRRAAARAGLPARGRRARLRPVAGREGQLGFWRWLSLFLGVAGTYRQNDSVDVVYQAAGRRQSPRGLPLATDELGVGQLDRLAVDEHAWPLDRSAGGPARHRVEHRVELVLGALLDPRPPSARPPSGTRSVRANGTGRGPARSRRRRRRSMVMVRIGGPLGGGGAWRVAQARSGRRSGEEQSDDCIGNCQE